GLYHVRLQDQLLVFRSEPLCDHPGVVRLVEVAILEANGKSLHWAGAGPRHQCHNRRRVRASAEQGSEWNISDQPNAYGFGEPVLQFFEALGFITRMVRIVLWQVPILLYPDLSLFKFQKFSWRQFLNRIVCCQGVS